MQKFVYAACVCSVGVTTLNSKRVIMNNFKRFLSLSVLVLAANVRGAGLSDSWKTIPGYGRALISLGIGAGSGVLVDAATKRSPFDKSTSAELGMALRVEAILAALWIGTEGDLSEGSKRWATRLPLLYILGKLVNTEACQKMVKQIPFGIGKELAIEDLIDDCEAKTSQEKQNRRPANWLRNLIQAVTLYVPTERFLEQSGYLPK